MMTLLDGPNARTEIKKQLLTAPRAKIAVAYWGRNAFAQLGMKHLKSRDVYIICDLMSGGCDPEEIKLLIDKFGHDRVLKLSQLHAKVWFTGKSAIVGSSNASTNGLGNEDSEVAGLIEANLLIEDDLTLAQIEKWFDANVRPLATQITQTDLKNAAELRKRSVPTRPIPVFPSLLEGLQSNPAYFGRRNLFVWVWKQNYMDDSAKRVGKSQRQQRKNSQIDWWQIPSNLSAGKGVLPGAHILEFDLPSDTQARLNGLFKVLSDDPKVKVNKTYSILLCKEVKTFDGLALGDRKIWQTAAAKAANIKKEWPIEEFAREFLKV